MIRSCFGNTPTGLNGFEGFTRILPGVSILGLPVLNTMAASKSEVRAMGKDLLKYPVERIYTGHCTGKKAYRVMKAVMGQRLEYFPTGRGIDL